MTACTGTSRACREPVPGGGCHTLAAAEAGGGVAATTDLIACNSALNSEIHDATSALRDPLVSREGGPSRHRADLLSATR